VKHGTKIGWTHVPGYKGVSWNPLTGKEGRFHCTKVSAGCEHCYAERYNIRFSRLPFKVGADEIVLSEPKLELPKTWTRKKRAVFVCSMTDLFHERVTYEMRDRIWAVMALCQDHIFMVLTKREQQLADYMLSRTENLEHITFQIELLLHAGWTTPKNMTVEKVERPFIHPLTGEKRGTTKVTEISYPWPLPNVWLGVTAEDQDCFDRRVPKLAAVPAEKRFVSMEPMLGPIDASLLLPALDWVLIGGESGIGARPMRERWVRAVLEQCRSRRVPAYVKQMGAWWQSLAATSLHATGISKARRRDPKGENPEFWPPDLRVRQFPTVISST